MSKINDMDHYLESISIFYDEKLKFLSTKDNFLRCKGCPTEKVFKEAFDEVSLSCGGKDKDDKCGMKINIKFPKYIHYEKDMDLLKNELETGLNLEKINEFIDVSESIKEDTKKRKQIEEKMKDITDKFYKINVQNKKKDIENFYRSRVEKTRRCREILRDIDNFEESQKVVLRREYISLIKNLNKEYIQIKELVETFQPFYIVKKPEVSLLMNVESEKKKIKKKPKKGKEKDNKDTIGTIVKHIISCNGYKTKDQLIKLWGEVGEGDVNLFPLYEMVKENLILKNKEWREKDDPPIVQASIQQYISGYKRFKNNLTKKDCKETTKEKEKGPTFTKGDIVHWESKGEILSGFIKTEKDVSGMIKIVNEEGRTFFIPKGKINIGEHEPEPEQEPQKVEVEEEEQENLYYFSSSKKNKWLSTFNKAESFKYNDMEYPTVEHAFNAQKVADDDPKVEEYRLALSTNISDVLTPNAAKKFGGKASFKENDFTLRDDWDDVKLKIMEEIIRDYYMSNTDLIDKLIETDNKLLVHKGFRIDTFWGVDKNDKGKNNHGNILMKLREEFKNA